MGPTRQVRHAIEEVSGEFQQPKNLTAALVAWESDFNPLAVGDGGDSYGLGQYNWRVRGWQQFQAFILFDSRANLRYCLDYFVDCLEATGLAVDDALSAYNQGIQGWRTRGKGLNERYWQGILDLWALYERGEVAWGASMELPSMELRRGILSPVFLL